MYLQKPLTIALLVVQESMKEKNILKTWMVNIGTMNVFMVWGIYWNGLDLILRLCKIWF